MTFISGARPNIQNTLQVFQNYVKINISLAVQCCFSNRNSRLSLDSLMICLMKNNPLMSTHKKIIFHK